MTYGILSVILLTTFISVHGFQLSHSSIRHHRTVPQHRIQPHATQTSLYTTIGDQPYSIQILMSDTGGGHRASANALKDALDTLYPEKIQCDIVDIFTDYGPFFPFNAFVPIYKIMAEYSFLWQWSYEYSATPFGLWFNEFILEVRVILP